MLLRSPPVVLEWVATKHNETQADEAVARRRIDYISASLSIHWWL